MKISKLFLSLLVVVLTTNVVSAQKLSDVITKYGEAGKAYQAKKYAEAITLFKATLVTIKKTTEDGIEEYEKNTNKYLGNSYKFHGAQLAKSQKFDAALTEFKEALNIAKTKTRDIVEQRENEKMISACYSFMADQKIKAKDFDGAAQICMTGLEANKNDTKLIIKAAQCKEKANKDEEAIKLYEKVIEIGKSTPRLKVEGDKAKNLLVNGQLVAASKLSEAGKPTIALAKIEKALTYSPNNQKAEYLKLQVYQKANDFNSIIKNGPAIATKLTSAEDKSNVYFMIGAAYVKLENNAAALEAYKKVTAGRNVATAKDQIELLNKAIAGTK